MGDEQRRRQQQISRDLSYARELQAQFDREASVITQPPPSSYVLYIHVHVHVCTYMYMYM